MAGSRVRFRGTVEGTSGIGSMHKNERGAAGLLAVLLGLVTVGSVLCLGSAHLEPLIAVGVLTTAMTLLAYRSPMTLPLPTPALIAIGLAAYTLLQATSMPLRWLEALAPSNADVWSR